jgi:Tol biopolymer transport system component
MKKLLLSSIVLFLFSASMVLFQISCKKIANADTPMAQVDGLKQLGKILYKGSNGKEIYIANYDGTGKQKVGFTAPNPTNINDSVDGASLSPDGKTVFLVLYSGNLNKTRLYSCNIDGNNLKLVLDHSEFSQSEGFYGPY